MKRWPLRIILLLILGAVTTVAVAWGFSFRRVGEWRRVATALWQRDFGGRWNSVLLDLIAKRYRILGMDRIPQSKYEVSRTLSPGMAGETPAPLTTLNPAVPLLEAA